MLNRSYTCLAVLIFSISDTHLGTLSIYITDQYNQIYANSDTFMFFNLRLKQHQIPAFPNGRGVIKLIFHDYFTIIINRVQYECCCSEVEVEVKWFGRLH